MIKRTLYFGSPAYLALKQRQLEIRQTPDEDGATSVRTIPIEDIGVVLLDHPQITITHRLLDALLSYNCAVVTCSMNHLPSGLDLNQISHTQKNTLYPAHLES